MVTYEFQRNSHVVMCQNCGFKHKVRTLTSVQEMPTDYIDMEFIHGDEQNYNLTRIGVLYCIKRDYECLFVVDNLSDWPVDELLNIAKEVVDYLNSKTS